MGFFALLCEIQALKVLTKVKGGLGVTYDILVKALRLKMDFLFLEFRNLGLGLSIFRFFGMTIEWRTFSLFPAEQSESGANKLKCQKNMSPPGAHLTKNLRRVQLSPGHWSPINLARMAKMQIANQASKVMFPGFWRFLRSVAGQNMSLPLNLPGNLVHLDHFLYFWLLTLTPITLAREDEM